VIGVGLEMSPPQRDNESATNARFPIFSLIIYRQKLNKSKILVIASEGAAGERV
jgi:hypothetical protein